MGKIRNLPTREKVFILSLVRHGFRVAKINSHLKRRCGYIIPSTTREDSVGIDFWVKLPGQSDLIPIQVTQRGTRLYRKYRTSDSVEAKESIERLDERSQRRLREKRATCRRCSTAFVLVRDYDGERMETNIAWGDKKALLRAVAS